MRLCVCVCNFLALCNISPGLQKWNIFSVWKGTANKCVIMQIVHNSYNEAKWDTGQSSDDSKINALLGEVLRFSGRTG